MSFPNDIIMLLALELDNSSLLNLCRTSKKYNKKICKNQTFWRLKIEKERPKLLELIDDDEKINYKQLYQNLQSDGFSLNYELSEIIGVVKGNINEYGFIPFYPDEEYNEYKIGDEVWVVIGRAIDSDVELVEPYMTKSKEEAMEPIKAEINHIHDDLVQNGYDLEEIEYYYKELEETWRVIIDKFVFNMDKIKIM